MFVRRVQAVHMYSVVLALRTKLDKMNVYVVDSFLRIILRT